jgi:hypothetical protein
MHSAVELLSVFGLYIIELIFCAFLAEARYFVGVARSLTVSIEDVEGVERQGNAFALHD